MKKSQDRLLSDAMLAAASWQVDAEIYKRERNNAIIERDGLKVRIRIIAVSLFILMIVTILTMINAHAL